MNGMNGELLKFGVIFVGGGLGAMMRYACGLLAGYFSSQNSHADGDQTHWLSMYPIATLLVNVIGCLAIGFVWGWLGEPKDDRGLLHAALIVGLLGGFTTFSSFGWETLELIQSGRILSALSYVVLSVMIGLTSAYGGYAMGSALGSDLGSWSQSGT